MPTIYVSHARLPASQRALQATGITLNLYPFTDYDCVTAPAQSFYIDLSSCTVVGGIGYAATARGAAVLVTGCLDGTCTCQYPAANVVLNGPSYCNNVVQFPDGGGGVVVQSAQWTWASSPPSGGGGGGTTPSAATANPGPGYVAAAALVAGAVLLARTYW